MNILMIPIPFFDKDMNVVYYFLSFYLDSEYFENENSLVFEKLVESLNILTLDTFTYKQPLFINIYNADLGTDLLTKINEAPSLIIYVLERDKNLSKEQKKSVEALKTEGYRFAFNETENPNNFSDELSLCDFYILDKNIIKYENESNEMKKIKPNIKILVKNLPSEREYRILKETKIDYFSGNFFENPISDREHVVNPLKTNYINLLKLVNQNDFDLIEFSHSVASDPALAYKFLRMVNSTRYGIRSKINSIRHAAAMLGQSELKKWISSAVATMLADDKPTEITRLSLLRAKFCENLADLFEVSASRDGLFLTGLFSLIDVVLELPMENALKVIGVSEKIKEALIDSKGEYYEAYSFVYAYESGDWDTVSKKLKEKNIGVSDVFEVFKKALTWYSKIVK